MKETPACLSFFPLLVKSHTERAHGMTIFRKIIALSFEGGGRGELMSDRSHPPGVKSSRYVQHRPRMCSSSSPTLWPPL